MRYLWGAVLCAGVLMPISCTVPVRTSIKLTPKPKRISKAPDARSQSLSDEAYKLIGQQKWKAALEPARQAVQLAPGWGEAHKNLAIALLHTGALKEAQVQAEAATRLSPDFDKAHDVLGQVLSARKQPRLALKSLNEAIRINPQYAHACYYAGLAYGDLQAQAKTDADAAKIRDKAEPMFARAVALDGTAPAYHREWGYLLTQCRRYDEAEREFRVVIKKLPHEEFSYNWLLNILHDEGRYDEYETLALQALPLVQPRSAYILYHLGSYCSEFSERPRYPEAIRYFRESISIDPTIGRAHDGLGLVMARNGRNIEAAGEFQKAVQLSPDYPMGHLHLGSALYDTGHHAAGRAEWRKAAALATPQDPADVRGYAAKYLAEQPE